MRNVIFYREVVQVSKNLYLWLEIAVAETIYDY